MVGDERQNWRSGHGRGVWYRLYWHVSIHGVCARRDGPREEGLALKLSH